ncbi:MAG: alpha-L-rhamnosidase C-terminal domain-containing protein [Verrucomicrobiota bacterium]
MDKPAEDSRYTVERKPLVQTEASPADMHQTEDGTLFIDFGKAAFGTVLIPFPSGSWQGSIVVHLGEKLTSDGRIDRNPPGSIRYIRIEQAPGNGHGASRIVIPPDERNTGLASIKMPKHIGEVFPFRYVEIENGSGIDPSAVRQIGVHYPFDDGASLFHSSDSVLNAVWNLCKYSIKATSFCGVYVDGDRERIPYEADAYINQLGHYCVDREYALARHTCEYLIQHPTWPTEWQMHSVMMAWADYMHTGETRSLEMFYDDLCTKTLVDLARDDGLISIESERCTREFEERLHLYHSRYVFDHGLRDLVDWPPGSFAEGGQGERDGHEMKAVNTVVNAFHYRALVLVSRIAGVLGRFADQSRFAKRADLVHAAINRLLFDPERGVYVDGEGSRHASLHSNMFALAFSLVPEERRKPVVSFVKSRGMACSVYGAQFLLESLYLNGEGRYALGLLTARHDRGWWNMMQVGSSMTTEAWDLKYKGNLDWNHAWGAAPANIIPRFLLGIRPLEPGFGKVLIQPQPGSLERVSGTIPTIRGSIGVALENDGEHRFALKVDIPGTMAAKVGLPHYDGKASTLFVDGKEVDAEPEGDYLFLDNIDPGTHVFKN